MYMERLKEIKIRESSHANDSELNELLNSAGLPSYRAPAMQQTIEPEHEKYFVPPDSFVFEMSGTKQ